MTRNGGWFIDKSVTTVAWLWCMFSGRGHRRQLSTRPTGTTNHRLRPHFQRGTTRFRPLRLAGVRWSRPARATSSWRISTGGEGAGHRRQPWVDRRQRRCHLSVVAERRGRPEGTSGTAVLAHQLTTAVIGVQTTRTGPDMQYTPRLARRIRRRRHPDLRRSLWRYRSKLLDRHNHTNTRVVRQISYKIASFCLFYKY